MRRRFYALAALFVVVVAFNLAFSTYSNSQRSMYSQVEAKRRETVEAIFAEMSEKREQASRLMSEVERRIDATPKPAASAPAHSEGPK